jgi:carboxymethylenebutenolidase
MANIIEITADDDFVFDAYRASPAGEVKGAILVIQEIFGVNQHIREVCDGYGAKGYIAVAPAIFDRVEKNVQLGYEGDDMTRGIEIARGRMNPDDTMRDLQATINYLSGEARVGVVGYCFGGLMAWLCACNAQSIKCAVGYYGGGIIGVVEQQPRVPTMLHFGNLDAHIPLSDVEKIAAAHPGVGVHVYDADHGFNCDHRASYNEQASVLAKSRSLAFFAEHLG